MDAEEFRGIWWIPPGRSPVAGTLTFDPDDGIRLALIGSFAEFNPEVALYARVFGHTPTLKPITLDDGHGSSVEFHLPGFVTEEIRAQTAFIGRHFSADEPILVARAFLSYTHLPEWVGSPLREDFGGPGFGLRIERPEFASATVRGATVKPSVGWQTRGDLVRDRTVSILHSFDLEFSPPITWDELVASWVGPLGNFLTLGVGRPSALERLEFKDPDAAAGDTVRALYRVASLPTRSGRARHPLEMLFSYQEVAADFDRILPAWFDATLRISDVCNLYFSTRHSDSYVEVEFLNLIQAVEVYHRRVSPGGVIPEDEHEARLTRILASAPEADREWLRHKLQYSNEPILRERVATVIEPASHLLAPLVESVDGFIRLVTTTRHYFTHYDPANAARAARGARLYHVNRRLAIAIEYTLLREMGLTDERIVQLFEHYTNYTDLRQMPPLSNR